MRTVFNKKGGGWTVAVDGVEVGKGKTLTEVRKLVKAARSK